MGLLISWLLLIFFAILATVDGFYLHIVKYKLYAHKESRFEHSTHTVRAVVFPLIVFFLFLQQNCTTSFYIGIGLVALDVLVLVVDAYVEKDSRRFMGGLPRWEYILHLFVNGFHFASIAVFLTVKLNITEEGIQLVSDLSKLKNYSLFRIIAQNLIPGAIALACIHIITSLDVTRPYWDKLGARTKCC